MIWIFIVSLFVTLAITRLSAHRFHDMKNYGTKDNKSKTITGLLRKITGKDIHHYHIGILLLFIAILLIAINGNTTANIVFLAVGTSLIIDQVVPAIDRRRNYFHKSQLAMSIFSHIILAIITLIFAL